MNRRNFAGGFAASLLGTAGIAYAMQTSEERLDDLDDRVSSLEERVTALENAPSDLNSAESSTTRGSSEDALIEVSGIGTSVSEKFTLQSGRYRADATLTLTSDFDGFSVFLHGPDGSEDLLFNEILEGGGVQQLSTVVSVRQEGDYFLETSNTSSSWTIAFSAF